MTFEELEARQSKYYEDVRNWFIGELAKWSEKHNAYMTDYGILEIWDIDRKVEYRPYGPYTCDMDDEYWREALSDYEALIDKLIELGYSCWQGLEYSDDNKFLH